MVNSIRYTFQIIFSCIGMLGCLFNIWIFIKYRENKGFAFELVIYLSISCLTSNIGYLIYNDQIINNKNLCIFQGIIILISESSQYIWLAIICYSIYKNVSSSLLFFETNPFCKSCCKNFPFQRTAL